MGSYEILHKTESKNILRMIGKGKYKIMAVQQAWRLTSPDWSRSEDSRKISRK